MGRFAAKVLRRGFAATCVSALVALALIHRNAASPSTEQAIDAPSSEGPARVAATCAAEPLPAHGVVYACDCEEGASAGCVPGDDAASGRDPAHALRSFGAAVRSLGASSGGTTAALCRGGSFRLEARVSLGSSACDSDHPCTLRDYAPAGDVRPYPRIAARSDALAIDPTPNRTAGYRIRNLDFVGEHQGTGLYLTTDVRDVDVCNVTLRGFQIGMHVARGSLRGVEDARRLASDAALGIRLRGSRIEESYHMGFLGSCAGCSVESNVFRANAEAGTVLNHPIYFDSEGVDERIVGNVLLENVHDRRGRCSGVVILVHGRHERMVIADNAIHEPLGSADGTCWGIALDPGEAHFPETFEHVVVRGNVIDDVGNVGIGIGACVDCRVEGNSVRQGNAFEATGIEAPDRPRGPGDSRLERLVIRENRIVFRGQAMGTGVRIGVEGTGHVIHGNTVEHRGSGALTCLDARASRASTEANRCLVRAPRSAIDRDRPD